MELNLDELDFTAAESKATYEEIKAYVLEHNKPKSENSRQPKYPPEKEKATAEALKVFWNDLIGRKMWGTHKK